MKKRVFSSFLIVLALGCWASAPNDSMAKAPTNPPNVLLILADDLGYSDLGCYGSEIETPNLDGLAKNGLRYTSFYNTARCWPTRSAILTGYYAQQIRRDTVPGIKSGGQGVRPGWATLLPLMLREKNYRNYHSGKWHIDGKPLQNGFDHSYDLSGASQSNFFKVQGITDDEKPIPQTENFYSTIGIADHAVRCLKEHQEKFAKRPFFHYLCFTAPHFPLHALPEDIAKYRERYQVGWNKVQFDRFDKMKSDKLVSTALPAMERDVGPPYAFPDAIKQLGAGEINRPLPWEELTEEQRKFQAEKMAIHAAMIDRMDREIGKVLAQLKAMNQFENTLIMFLSDNGASAEIMVRGLGHDPAAPLGSAMTYPCLGPGWSSCSNTPFRRHKTWVHEGGISTPLVIHWPQGIKAKNQLRHMPSHVIDVVPTILELTGATAPAKWKDEPVPKRPGQSLVKSFQEDPPEPREELWWLHEENKALRAGNWKIVAAKGDPWELYDLKTDRGETKNLAAEQPERVKTLAARWEERFEECKKLALTDPPPAAAEAPKKKGKKQ